MPQNRTASEPYDVAGIILKRSAPYRDAPSRHLLTCYARITLYTSCPSYFVVKNLTAVHFWRMIAPSVRNRQPLKFDLILSP